MINEKITESFLELIEEYKKLIYKVSHMYCDVDINKKDLFQEIIANLWKAYPQYRGEAKVSTWIYKIALNTAVSWLRDYIKDHSHIHYTNEMPQMLEDDPKFDDLYEQLYYAIGNLGKIDKALILLQLDGYSYDEISEIVGISKTNVATKIGRIKSRLKEQLIKQ